MSLYVTDREQPVGKHGGRAKHYLVNCVLAETEEERSGHIAFLDGLCYTTDRFPLNQLEPSDTFPYAGLVPKQEGNRIVLDRTNSSPIVSIVKEGKILRSVLYELEPDEPEIDRLAETFGLGEAPVVVQIGEYATDQPMSAFMEQEEHDTLLRSFKQLRLFAIGTVIGALAIGAMSALDVVTAMQLKEESGKVSVQIQESVVRKQQLEAILKRPGLPAEEQLRTETVSQSLRAIYPAPISGFERGELQLRIDHPSTAKLVKGGNMKNPYTVSVTLPELTPPAEATQPVPTGQGTVPK